MAQAPSGISTSCAPDPQHQHSRLHGIFARSCGGGKTPYFHHSTDTQVLFAVVRAAIPLRIQLVVSKAARLPLLNSSKVGLLTVTTNIPSFCFCFFLCSLSSPLVCVSAAAGASVWSIAIIGTSLEIS